MRRNLFLATASLVATAAAARLYRRYRQEIREVEAELDAARQVIETETGAIEYGRHGCGRPVLMIHGAGGGFDQGLLLGDELFGPDFSVVAPSRFGYLGAPVPEAASPADQADAHAALLDALEIRQAIVVGVSAGAPSAIEMALRHPDRTAALILVVPRAYAPGASPVSAPRESAGLVQIVMAGADFVFWALTKRARATVVRFLGVPPSVEAAAAPEDRARVSEIMRHILPLSRRIEGLRNDSRTVIGEWPLERITAPTLVISTEDDLYRTLPAARYTTARIPGAELIALPSGGHLLVGWGEELRNGVRDFLQRSVRPKAMAA